MRTLLGHRAGAHSAARVPAAGLDRPLALRRRADVVAVPQTFSGKRIWAVKDPVALRYFHLRDEEYFVLQALDGRTSLAEIQERFENRFAPHRLSRAHLQSFLAMLHQEGLILAEAPGQTGEVLERAAKLRRQKLLSGLANVLAIRFRGIDPQRFLDWLLTRCGWIFSPLSLVLGAAVAAAALALVLTRFDAVLARVPGFDSFLTPATLIWLTATLASVKILHELGHALACRLCGAECHELGFMLLVFTPCLYCNVSDSWMLESKWRRAAIAAAGVAVELVLAGAGTLLWWFSEPGLLNSLCFNVMLVCSVGTLLFNANPLMRYDGYYILADLAEIPNLSQVASGTTGETLGEWLLGIPARPFEHYSPVKRLFLATYAVLSAVYRVVIVVGILWFLHRLLKPHQLEFVVVIVGTVVLGGIIAPPLWGMARYLQHAWWSRQMNTRRALLSTLLIVLVLAAIGLAPLPHWIAAPVVLEAENARPVYVPVAGTIVEGQAIGSSIGEGAPLAVLRNLDLELEVARLRGQRNEQKLRLENLNHRQTHDARAAAQIPVAEEALADLEERLARRLEDQERLVISAPASGTILPGRLRPRQYDPSELATWSGLPLDATNRGCFLETGTLLCQIGDPEKFEASVVLDQQDMEFIRAGQDVQIQLDEYPGRLLRGKIREIAEIDLKITPPELLPAGTLPTRPDESGVYRPAGTVYQARVTLEPAETPLVIGAAGRAKVHAPPLSLARRLARYLSHTFRFEL